MGRVLRAVGGGAGLLSTIFAAGWTGVILILSVVMILTAAVCWVIADAKRPARLAMLLRAWRAGSQARNRPAPEPKDHEPS
jgi:hypothetical protein